MDLVNENPWNWMPAMVKEFSADLRTVKHVSHSTLRGYHSALRAFADPPMGLVCGGRSR